ncbi:MAG: OmpA family protein [Pseudomonadota bacterium]
MINMNNFSKNKFSLMATFLLFFSTSTNSQMLETSGSASGSVLGKWVGTYTCAQGLTGVTLSIAEATSIRARAMFHFYADPRNPNVPSGCFTMDGNYEPSTGELQLKGSEWLLRPSNYRLVSFNGIIDAEGRDFQGLVSGAPRCTTFNLTRQPSPAPENAECEIDTRTSQADQMNAGTIRKVLTEEGSIDLNILFDFAEATIRPDSRNQLDELGRILLSPALAEHRIGIYGHTDAMGSEESNQNLSEQRAVSVRDYLIKQFNIQSERFEVRGFGKERLKNPNAPLDEVNRRVEIVRLNGSND